MNYNCNELKIFEGKSKNLSTMLLMCCSPVMFSIVAFAQDLSVQSDVLSTPCDHSGGHVLKQIQILRK